eukprot:TRINITY_DN11488_c0_g1_i1.p2 TRINITY_DN11488_c0_g1~~TRINITY_DN11488_c0_g1_i1.p2  ORF type:complete len:100 (+),score=7.52 TRINITY_DN11488_c0_g1_i1:292-591(+)
MIKWPLPAPLQNRKVGISLNEISSNLLYTSMVPNRVKTQNKNKRSLFLLLLSHMMAAALLNHYFHVGVIPTQHHGCAVITMKRHEPINQNCPCIQKDGM